MPLIEDDEEQQNQEEPRPDEPIEQVAQKTIQTSASFKTMLIGIGNWLARRKLPDSMKKGLRDEWTYIWTNERPGKQPRKKEKFMAQPFKSFGPQKKKDKKGKL